MAKIKIRYNGKVEELTDCCRWQVRDRVLFNMNTGHDEGVEGDIVEYSISGTQDRHFYKGHVVGSTCYQFIETKEWGKVVLPAEDARRVRYTHVTPVELVED